MITEITESKFLGSVNVNRADGTIEVGRLQIADASTEGNGSYRFKYEEDERLMQVDVFTRSDEMRIFYSNQDISMTINYDGDNDQKPVQIVLEYENEGDRSPRVLTEDSRNMTREFLVIYGLADCDENGFLTAKPDRYSLTLGFDSKEANRFDYVIKGLVFELNINENE